MKQATFNGIEIKEVGRWARNGRYYHWCSLTQKKLDELIKKYRVDQIDSSGMLWLES